METGVKWKVNSKTITAVTWIIEFNERWSGYIFWTTNYLEAIEH